MDKEKKKAYNQAWRQSHKEERKLYNQKYRESHREEHNANARRFYQTHKEEILAYNREDTRKTKREVLTHYGNGKYACVKCGFGDSRALSIDHINSGGRKERIKLGKATGGKFYYWLRAQGYPEGYQTLCMNCNGIKRFTNGENVIKEE